MARETKSEIFLKNKVGDAAPSITNKMYRSVSAQRRVSMAEQVEEGVFKDGSSASSFLSKNNSSTDVGNIVSSSRVKLGQSFSSGGSSGSYQGSGNTVSQGPDVYSPLLLNSNLNLPRDKHTINAWCRTFFEMNPFVSNAINLHSTYPISKLNITCPNKDIEKFFKNMAEELDLMNICIQIASEYWLLGEAVIYADYDENLGKWTRLVLQNPDNIIVEPSAIGSEPNIFLKPDRNLEKIVRSNRPSDIEQRKQLPQNIIECVRMGKNIPLPSFNVSMLARKSNPYALRGVGLPFTVFKQLMLFDRLRESKYAQADDMINPVTVVKIGSAEYKPTFADLEAWRTTFENASNDKNFKIFTHEGVTIEKVGAGTAIFDISGDITQMMKEIFIGLQIPQVLMDGGESSTYANGGVSLDVLRGRYITFRNMLSAWLKKKIFAPISKVQNFYDLVDGEKQLIIPDIDWNHMALFDTDSYITQLTALATGESKKVSLQSLHRSLGLDTVDEQRSIRREAIQDAIAKKEVESLAMMDLNTLRSLNEDNEIPEMSAEPGGTPPGAGGGGGDPGGGLDMGGPLPGQEAPPPPPG